MLNEPIKSQEIDIFIINPAIDPVTSDVPGRSTKHKIGLRCIKPGQT